MAPALALSLLLIGGAQVARAQPIAITPQAPRSFGYSIGDRVERVVEIELNSSERAMFEKSVGAVETLVEACKKIAPDLLGC